MDANSALQQASGQTGNVGSLLQQEQIDLGPMRQNLDATQAQQIPQPQLQKSPKPPDIELAQSATEWTGVLNVLAGIAGTKSRGGATAGLQAFADGMKGFQKGSMDAIQQAQTKWKEANASVIDNNKDQIAAYKEALQNKKLSIDEQMAEIKNVSLQYHNDIMAQLAEAKNFTAIGRVVDMMENQNNKLQSSVDKMQQQLDIVNEKMQGVHAAADVYKEIYPPNPIDGKRPAGAPDFKSWFKNDWPTYQKNQEDGSETPTPTAASSNPTPPPAGQRVTIYKGGKAVGTVPMEQLQDAIDQDYTQAP